MYCTNCGKVISGNINFCPECGTKVKLDTYSSANALTTIHTINNGSIISFKEKTDKFIKNNSKNKKLYIIGFCTMILIAIFAFFNMPSQINKTPESVIQSFFKAIQNEDVDLLLKCLVRDDIRDDDGKLYTNKKKLKQLLHRVNVEAKNNVGDKWLRELEVLSTNFVTSSGEIDPSLKVVTVSLSGIQQLMVEFKNGKYYLSKEKGRDISNFSDILYDKMGYDGYENPY